MGLARYSFARVCWTPTDAFDRTSSGRQSAHMAKGFKRKADRRETTLLTLQNCYRPPWRSVAALFSSRTGRVAPNWLGM